MWCQPKLSEFLIPPSSAQYVRRSCCANISNDSGSCRCDARGEPHLWKITHWKHQDLLSWAMCRFSIQNKRIFHEMLDFSSNDLVFTTKINKKTKLLLKKYARFSLAEASVRWWERKVLHRERNSVYEWIALVSFSKNLKNRHEIGRNASKWNWKSN